MKSPLALALSATIAASLAAAAGRAAEVPAATDAMANEADAASADAPAADNPFLEVSTLQYQYPHFDRIDDAHFMPAFKAGMEQQRREIAAITLRKDVPSFENTLVALELSGDVLSRTSSVFFNLVGADTNPERQKIQADVAPLLSAHRDAIFLDGALFKRLDSLHQRRDELELDPESRRLLERYHTDFVRAGARLGEAEKTRLREINSTLAKLNTEFGQNVLKEVNAAAVVVDERAELAGLDDNEIAAAAEAAKSRKLEGKFVIALQNTSDQPPLESLTDRALRERIYQASNTRGSQGGEFDNRAIVASTAKLRAERAQLLGYRNHATYALEDQTAKTTDAVNKLLAQLAPAAVGNARREAADLQKIVDDEARAGDTEPFAIAGWDWAFYTEKLRKQRYDFDANELKPYLELDNVLVDGVFHAAEKLYGLTFKERRDLPVYHPDVRVFEVFDNGKPFALFLTDFYARESKRGGAWMNAYVSQSELENTHPVVANHLNIPKPPAGEPTLLTFDQVTTLFHEFGHALHGMFSDVRYPRFSGTSVPRDFVEYPSQVNEMWATWPSVLANYAKHHETGEPMPKALLDKVLASEQFNQGFATTEYLAAALLDQRWHQTDSAGVPSADGVLAFEARALADAGVDFAPVAPRYRTTYFSHIFSGGYAAGYYSYIWSEVLDAESVEWFKEKGGLKRENGDHFRKTLLSRGGSKDALELFRDFRGREPQIAPLLKRRGLTASAQPNAPASDDATPPNSSGPVPPTPG